MPPLHDPDVATAAHGSPAIIRRRRVAGRSAGFTLMELMIAVVIIAILAAIAWPIYSKYITKTRRVAAEGCLSEYANYMERYYTTHLRYNNDGAGNDNSLVAANLDCAGNQQTGRFYQYALPAASVSVSAYVVTATPQGIQATNDTKCGMLSVDQTGKRDADGTEPGSCW
ncbi:type IV pilin protein [Rhodanobacter ginsengiterrae]|uniref:type IV pilin protein n=1 Tax=Rhodanobacter ginsengiterrae TaxID=2008451 RepID=UPI003CFAD555